VGTAGTPPYDLIRDTVADLGVGLVRMEQRRQALEDLFRPEAPGEIAEEADVAV
jgi:ABC-2 type transport system ATP-binding protein